MKITRDQYLIAQSLLNGIRAADTCFCENSNAGPLSSFQIKQIAQQIASDTTLWQVENCSAILSLIQKLKEESRYKKPKSKR